MLALFIQAQTLSCEAKEMLALIIAYIICCRPVEAVLWSLHEDRKADVQETHYSEAGIALPWNR